MLKVPLKILQLISVYELLCPIFFSFLTFFEKYVIFNKNTTSFSPCAAPDEQLPLPEVCSDEWGWAALCAPSGVGGTPQWYHG